MDKLLVAGLIVLAVFLSGCVQQPICGNGICEAGENDTVCPQDCQTHSTETHFECQNELCVEVLGAGENQCATDANCLYFDENIVRLSQGCIGLTTAECNAYKLSYLQRVFETYKEYHDMGNQLFLEYNNSVLKIVNNNDFCNSAVGLHPPPSDKLYSFPQTVVRAGGGVNTEFNEIRQEFERRHLIVDETVHGSARTRGLALVYPEQEIQNSCAETYTTLQEFLLFRTHNRNPFLFERSSSCMESVVAMDGVSSFCCWPQASMLSGYWALLHFAGNTEARNNSLKFISDSATIGQAYLRTGGGKQVWVFGDITAKLPSKQYSALECGFAPKMGIECECTVPSENKLAVVLKENSTYDNTDLENIIMAFLDSVEKDTEIQNVGIKKFSGANFTEFDAFIESLNASEGVNFFIFVGEDLPIFGESGEYIGPSYGPEDWTNLNFVGDPPLIGGCVDIVFSIIVPPLDMTKPDPKE